MNQLSPPAQVLPSAHAAQAVLNATNTVFSQAGTTAQGIAAAIRVVSARMMHLGYDSFNSKYLEGIEVSSDFLDQIATELEAL
jgi:hypothetical protein